MTPRGADHSLPRWQEQTAGDVERAVGDDTVVLLPIAAIEQHGPHLPLSTDLEIARGLVREAFHRLPDGVPALVLPPQVWGASLEHAAFPGTVSLSAGLVTEIIYQVGRSIARSGARRLVVLNAHGGNRASLDSAALRLRVDASMLVVKASYTRFARPEGLDIPDAEWTRGLHGGAVETAMMMHLRPDLVRGDAVGAASPLGAELEGDFKRIGPEGQAPFAWCAGDLDPSGSAGDASLASAATGRALVEHYGGVLAEVIREASEFPLDRLAPAD